MLLLEIFWLYDWLKIIEEIFCHGGFKLKFRERKKSLPKPKEVKG